MEKKGESLKNLLKGNGFEINEIADRLKMSRSSVTPLLKIWLLADISISV
jgi:predicted transcriptional regulator